MFQLIDYFAVTPVLILSAGLSLFFHRIHHKIIFIFVTRFFQGGLDIRKDTCWMTCTLSRQWSEGPTRRPHTFFLPSFLFLSVEEDGWAQLPQTGGIRRERETLSHRSSYTEATSRCLCSCNCLKKFWPLTSPYPQPCPHPCSTNHSSHGEEKDPDSANHRRA